MSNEHENTITIVVNGRQKPWEEKRLSFTEAVELAYPGAPPTPERIYTVTYKRGDDKKPEGSLVAGDDVRAKEGMIFNVFQTDRS